MNKEGFSPMNVPKDAQWCFACDGGKSNQHCFICGGKGYWDADDIDSYHRRFPKLCKSNCGEKHIRPDMSAYDPYKYVDMLKDVAALFREIGLEENAKEAEALADKINIDYKTD